MVKSSKFCVYTPPEPIFLLLGWGVGYNAILLFICLKMQSAGYDSIVLFGLLFPIWLLWLVVSISMVKSGLAYRLMLQISFDSSGIHYYLLGFHTHCIPWSDINTFGIYGYSVSYIQKELIIFSTNKYEYAPKTLPEANHISHNRIIVQYRRDVWQAMQPYLPKGMIEKLSDAIDKKQDCFHKC